MTTPETIKPEEAPEITPQVLHLRDLLKWVRQGRVRVPNFQRDFTWDRPRMINLFDSIRKQYPIGTLLFWESTKPLPMSDGLGPLRLADYPGGKLLVLDGQQRLTTLAGVLLFDELKRNPADDRDPNRWLIYYDAASDAFTYFNDPAPLSAVRVSDLLGTKGLFSAAQRIRGSSSNEISESMRSMWMERIESVSAALHAYRVPLVIFATDSLRLAVESFTRLNRSGQSMGPDEMFSALTYTTEGDQETFRLAKEIDVILAEIVRTSFGQLDRVVVLRVILLAAELDPFRTEWDQLANKTRTEAVGKLPDAIREARKGLLDAVDFLRIEGIRNCRLLPYTMQLVGLAAFFGRRNGPPTEQQAALLRRWLWVSAFTETFGGLNPSRILMQLKNLRDIISTQDSPTTVDGIDLDAPAHPFPERYDPRSARARALLCVMLRNPTLNSDGTPITPDEMAAAVLQRGSMALFKVCTKVENRNKTPLASSPANRIFDIMPAKRGKGKLFELKWTTIFDPPWRENFLESHHISKDAWTALLQDDYTGFIEKRTATLMDLERRFMEEKGVIPPKSTQPAPSAIDVEDDVPLNDDENAGAI